MSDSNTFTITKQDRSKGGKARAEKLTPEERKAIAIKANHSKKCYNGLAKATHSGELIIGSTNIACAVLEDGTSVINQASILNVLGRSRIGGKRKKSNQMVQFEKLYGEQPPSFLMVSNLIPFICNDLIEASRQITYFSPNHGKRKGFKAEIIPLIADLYLLARNAGVLTKDQKPIAERSELIVRALARVGIESLIHEATGFERDKENNHLLKLFEKFISKELQPWTKRFPNEFFENIKRWYGLEHLKGNPSFIGCFINKFVYEEISPEILDELKKRNPMVEGGYRKNRHHQLLTTDIGHPTLEKQILKINTLMSASDSKEEFDVLFQKLKR